MAPSRPRITHEQGEARAFKVQGEGSPDDQGEIDEEDENPNQDALHRDTSEAPFETVKLMDGGAVRLADRRHGLAEDEDVADIGQHGDDGEQDGGPGQAADPWIALGRGGAAGVSTGRKRA
jgi:hypothetical protein